LIGSWWSWRAGALAVLAGLCLLPAVAVAREPVRLAAAFSEGARLGRSTAMSVALDVDPRLPPVAEVRILTAAGLSLSNSRLGAVSCVRPALEIAEIMNPLQRERRCAANSLIGTGTATAGLVLNETETLFGDARIALQAGAPVEDKPGVVITVETFHPARMQLTYVGYFYVPPPAFGLGLAIKLPPMPNPPFGAQIALSTLALTVGDPSITYTKLAHGRRVAYRPGGIPLPGACPRHGFRFRAILRFADASRRTTDAVVPCPRAPSRHQ
jgi:hypothetical protein